MNGYSKIKLVRSTKSRSVDLSDLLSFAERQKPFEENTGSNKKSLKILESEQIKNTKTTHESPSEPQDAETGSNEDRPSMKLSRNCSVSSSSSQSQWFRLDKPSKTAALQTAVRRAFSMRRSSSVSERYCRIHDQCEALTSPLNDEDDDDAERMDMDMYSKDKEMPTRSVKKNKSRNSSGNKILKACKRLFGL